VLLTSIIAPGEHGQTRARTSVSIGRFQVVASGNSCVAARIFDGFFTGPLLADQKYLADGEALFGGAVCLKHRLLLIPVGRHGIFHGSFGDLSVDR
jgi:hypothetical protein